MTHQGATYDFHTHGDHVSVEHMGPDGLIVRDGMVYLDHTQGHMPADVVAVARKILEAICR